MTERSERQSGTETRGWRSVREDHRWMDSTNHGDKCSNDDEEGQKRQEEEKRKTDKEHQSEKREPESERAGKEHGVRKDKGTAGTRSRNEQ